MTIKEAWEIIKDVDLSHMTYDSDEDYSGDWVYEAVEVDDGTVEDNFPEECVIVDEALKELDEYKKCIDLEQATYISTHNMSVVDTETYNLLHRRSQILELLKDKLDFYFDAPHQCVKIRLNHRLVGGKELVLECNKEEFNSLKEF